MVILMEKEFFKRYNKNIINVSKIDKNTVEYIVEDNNNSEDETVTVYRFKNGMQVDKYDVAKEDLDVEEIIYNEEIKLMTNISRVLTIILYSMVIANIEVLNTLPKELVIATAIVYGVSTFKLCKAKLGGITDRIKANYMAKNNIINTMALAFTAISVYISQQRFISLALCLVIAIIVGTRYMMDILRCTDMSLIYNDRY